jgi:WXG100 family type VII secretion target
MVQMAAQTEDIHQKAMAVQQDAAEVEAMLGKLTAAMSELASTWRGPAASAFQQRFAGWATQARNMRQTLEAIGQSLNSAGTDYEQLESQIASHMH